MLGQQAKVQSIGELDAFRASLVVYLERAGRLLDDARQEVVRMRNWLQTDRQLHWRNELRRRSRALEQAEQELLTARLGGHEGAIQDRRMAVHRAQRAVEDAKQGQARVKRWIQHYEAEVESHLVVIHRLRQVLGHDMRMATNFLETAADTLAEYAGVARPQSGVSRTATVEAAPGLTGGTGKGEASSREEGGA